MRLLIALVALLFGLAASYAVTEDRKQRVEDLACLRAGMHIAQLTAELARTEAALRALDPDEECDLACSETERQRDILMSEIRDWYKVKKDHKCGKELGE